jgi:uncharacterized protein
LDNVSAAIGFLRHQDSVDQKKIFILGHSEGTQMASDYSKKDKQVAGYILLGYTGENIHNIIKWQLVERPIELFISTDVDTAHSGYVTREQASHWPGPIMLDDEPFNWPWKESETRLSYSEIRDYLTRSTHVEEILEKAKKSALYREVYDRTPIYKETVKIEAPLYVFTGSLDLQTPVAEIRKLKMACEKAGKRNCFIKIIPGVGHGFSPPRGPRRQPLADLTVGPISPILINELDRLAKVLKSKGDH